MCYYFFFAFASASLYGTERMKRNLLSTAPAAQLYGGRMQIPMPTTRKHSITFRAKYLSMEITTQPMFHYWNSLELFLLYQALFFTSSRLVQNSSTERMKRNLSTAKHHHIYKWTLDQLTSMPTSHYYDM